MNQVSLSDNRDVSVQAKELILQHIRKNDYKLNDRLPSNRKFAEMVNTSSYTVQHAVSSLVKDGILYARRGMGTYLKTDPSVSVPQKQRTGLYACIIPRICSNTVATTVYALDDLIFTRHGHHMIISNSRLDFERELQLLKSMLERDVDAIIYQPNPLVYIRPLFARAVNSHLQKLQSAGIPVIMLDWFPGDEYDTVVPSEKQTCELALKHLIELGHNRILFVVQPELFKPKLEAFKKVLEEFNLSSEQVHFVNIEGYTPHKDTFKALNKIYDECRPFTAIIACSDRHALGCYQFLKSKGIKCPEDVSIVGADNVEFTEDEALDSFGIGLTTVWCEPVDVARKLNEIIELRLQQQDLQKTKAKIIEVSPTLVLRNSTARSLLRFDNMDL